MRPSWRHAQRQIQGGRPYQEDDQDVRALALDGGGAASLAVLADGMGGHAGGAVASALAVAAFHEAAAAEAGAIPGRLRAGLRAAGEAIRRRVAAEPALAGMGCTLVGLVLEPRAIHWISVGDSPLWLFQDGTLTRLNADHSMAPLLRHRVARGEMTAAAAAIHPARNALRSAVTGEPVELVDEGAQPLAAAGRPVLILASDGLCTLDEGAIGRIAGEAGGDPRRLVDRLIEAVERDGRPDQDNTTVLAFATA